LSGLSSGKGREPQPGTHSKPDKSESKVSMQNDDKFTESDKDIMRNLDITSAVMNLRKFKKMLKSKNLMNSKGEQNDTNKEIHDVDAKIPVEPAQHFSTTSPNERSRSVVQERRSTSKTISRGDSRDRQDINHYSKANQYYYKNDYKCQKQENPSQFCFCFTVRITEEFTNKSMIAQLVRSHVNIQYIHILVVVTTTNNFPPVMIHKMPSPINL